MTQKQEHPGVGMTVRQAIRFGQNNLSLSGFPEVRHPITVGSFYFMFEPCRYFTEVATDDPVCVFNAIKDADRRPSKGQLQINSDTFVYRVDNALYRHKRFSRNDVPIRGLSYVVVGVKVYFVAAHPHHRPHPYKVTALIKDIEFLL